MLQRITQVFGLGGEETGRPAASVKLHAEWLEARAVPASVTLSSGVVVIRGDEVADEFRIDVDRGNVSVSQARGGVFREVARYSGSRVGSVVYYGYGGNDRLANNTNLPLTAYGGSGDDVIVGGSGVDYLYGDQGVDWLYGGGGEDWIYGGPSGTPSTGTRATTTSTARTATTTCGAGQAMIRFKGRRARTA